MFSLVIIPVLIKNRKRQYGPTMAINLPCFSLGFTSDTCSRFVLLNQDELNIWPLIDEKHGDWSLHIFLLKNY